MSQHCVCPIPHSLRVPDEVVHEKMLAGASLDAESFVVHKMFSEFLEPFWQVMRPASQCCIDVLISIFVFCFCGQATGLPVLDCVYSDFVWVLG